MGDELKELLKEGVGGGHIFKTCDISLENTPTSGSQSSPIYGRMQCHFCYALAYTITANGVCLHFLVPPLAQCSILRCFLLSCITACTSYNVNRWAYFQEKSNLWNNFIHKNEGWLVFEGRPILRDLRYCITADIQDCLSQSGLVIYLCFRNRERSLPENHLWHNWKLNYLNSSQTLLPMISYCTSQRFL